MEYPTIHTEGRLVPPRQPVTCEDCGEVYCECCDSSCPNIHCACTVIKRDLLAALEAARDKEHDIYTYSSGDIHGSDCELCTLIDAAIAKAKEGECDDACSREIMEEDDEICS